MYCDRCVRFVTDVAARSARATLYPGGTFIRWNTTAFLTHSTPRSIGPPPAAIPSIMHRHAASTPVAEQTRSSQIDRNRRPGRRRRSFLIVKEKFNNINMLYVKNDPSPTGS